MSLCFFCVCLCMGVVSQYTQAWGMSHTCMRQHTCPHMSVFWGVFRWLCVYVHIFVPCVCIVMCCLSPNNQAVSAESNSPSHTNTHTHTRTHTHTHRQTHSYKHKHTNTQTHTHHTHTHTHYTTPTHTCTPTNWLSRVCVHTGQIVGYMAEENTSFRGTVRPPPWSPLRFAKGGTSVWRFALHCRACWVRGVFSRWFDWVWSGNE